MSKIPRFDSFSIDKAGLTTAYPRVRARLAKDPLFSKNARAHGVSLAKLDGYMKAPPGSASGLMAWLDGPDQFRYAGLAVLQAAFGNSVPPAQLETGLTVPKDASWLVPGDLVISGQLELETGAGLFVLGALVVNGCLLAPDGFSVIAARDLSFQSGITGGELIALRSIKGGARVYLSGNDYSCRAPTFAADVLVDFERHNAYEKVRCKVRVSDWDFAASADALGVSRQGELAKNFTDALRAGKPAMPKTSETAVIDEEELWQVARTGTRNQCANALERQSWSESQLQVALQYAAKWGNAEALSVMLAAGVKDFESRALARITESVNCLKMLLDAAVAGVDTEVNGSPLLLLMSNVGSDATLSFLLTHGADPNTCDRNGLTALHVCAFHGHTKKAKLLLDAGARVDSVTRADTFRARAGASALDVALQQEKANGKAWSALVKLLSQKPAPSSKKR